MLKEINNKEWKLGNEELIGVKYGSDIIDYADTFCGIRTEDVDKFNKGISVPVYTAVKWGSDIIDYAESFGVVMVNMRTRFLNISNHNLNNEQIKDIRNILGEDTIIIELPEKIKELWSNLSPDNYKEVVTKVKIFMLKNGIFNAHLAGFMPAVHELLKWEDVRRNFYYSFSVRESVEEVVNGATIKKSVFRHKGWYRY